MLQDMIDDEVNTPINRRKNQKHLTGRRFIFTSAQSDTPVHKPFWDCLRKYAAEIGATIHVSQFTYNKNTIGASGQKVGTEQDVQVKEPKWDKNLQGYFSNEEVTVCKDLVWCGNLNIMPTATNPLTGFDTYTRSSSCILPHPKIALKSIPNMKMDETKMLYTTGVVTHRNYIQKTAGQKAEFHHCFGALLVEVSEDGEVFWARHLNATDDGSFYDLDARVTQRRITYGKRAAAITHGDIHSWHVDPAVVSAVWGKTNEEIAKSVMTKLNPLEQFLHDVFDFTSRNHHTIDNALAQFKIRAAGMDSILDEIEYVRKFILAISSKDTSTFIVSSNHDLAFDRWINNHKGHSDPINSELWHYLNYDIRTENISSAFYAVYKRFLANIPNTFLIKEDDSYKILGEIEAGLHGHLGANGSRGSPKTLASVGKSNSGHTHAAYMFEGVAIAGHYCQKDMKYNKGLGGWSQSFILTYENAKRTIVTLKQHNGVLKAWDDPINGDK